MAQNTIGTIPEFTGSESTEQPQEEVKEEVVSPTTEEKATPELPAEKPAEEPQAPSEVVETPIIPDLEKTVSALQEQRVELLKEISELRGQKREIKQEQLLVVDKQIDELKDVNPADVELIDKVLRNKGYIRKDEASGMFYQAVQTEETKKFLDKYPEYKPENDPGDINWQSIIKEYNLYKPPTDPHLIGQLLERAHKSVPRISPTSANIPVQKKRIEVASHGSGGTQSPSQSSSKGFTAEQKIMYRQGGWTEEEITNMEKKLPD